MLRIDMLFLQNRGKTSEQLFSGVDCNAALHILRSFVKEKLSIFFLALLATTIRIICIFQLYFFVAVCLSHLSPPLLHWCQIYRNKTDVQKYCSENWKKRERKSTQSHKNKYNCEVSRVNNGTSIKTAKLRRDFVSSSQLFCNLTHKKASFWWDYKK